jgi:hypothetical protein
MFADRVLGRVCDSSTKANGYDRSCEGEDDADIPVRARKIGIPKTDLPRVPEDTRVTFYTQNAKTLWIQEAVKILNGTTQFNDSCRRSKDRGQYPGESDYPLFRLYRLRWREADRRSEIHFSRVHACRVECPETRQLVACRREFVSIQGTAPLLSRLRHRSGFGEPGAD